MKSIDSQTWLMKSPSTNPGSPIPIAPTASRLRRGLAQQIACGPVEDADKFVRVRKIRSG